jgi:hypothetical protein
VYRHALDIDDSGDVLAFGSTTGSLWVSENAGNSWQTRLVESAADSFRQIRTGRLKRFA